MAIFGKKKIPIKANSNQHLDDQTNQIIKVLSDAFNENLDFDVGYVFSPELWQDPMIAKLLQEVGLPQESRDNKMSLLKDAKVVQRVQQSPADDKLRTVLVKSGIGMVHYDRGVPNGYDHKKTSFHLIELRKIIGMDYDLLAKRRAVFDLHRFTALTMRGQPTT